MKTITIRNIPEDIINKIKLFSKLEKRSLNNEILIILEKGISKEIVEINTKKKMISNQTQIDIWKNLSGKWEDTRTSKEIIEDIVTKRSQGRNVEL
ncbi:MAG: FitA-like ribbon-helix-helix domain-containing protein [bacterium]